MRISRSFVDDSGKEVKLTLDTNACWYKFMNVTYTMIAGETTRILLKAHLPGDATNLLMWMWDRLRFGNIISGYTYTEMGKHIDPEGNPRSKARVCEMLRELEKLNLLRRERSFILLNPHYQYRGTAANQNLACLEWDSLPALTAPDRKLITLEIVREARETTTPDSKRESAACESAA